MAYSTIANPVAGTPVPTTTFGQLVVNNFAAITGASASYGSAAATWGSTGTAPAINNGTFTATFRQDAKWVDLFIQITWGSTTTAGTGIWTLALPVAARFTRWIRPVAAFDNSATGTYMLTADAASTTSLNIRGLLAAPPVAQGNVPGAGGTQPFGAAWATGDILTVDLRYEAA